MSKGKIHEFHFVVSHNTHQKLKQLSKKLNIHPYDNCREDKTTKKKIKNKPTSLSTTIVYIFEQMNAFLEKNHLTALEKDSKYELISHRDEKKVHIHCYMSEDLYRKLKIIHHDLNVYSLAQILRKMITFFLNGCIKYGIKKLNTQLNKIKKLWVIKKTVYQKENKIFVRQLSDKIRGIYYCRTLYGINYRPYQIQYLERV